MSLPAKIEILEQVGDLHLKSYKPTEIARQLGITPAAAKNYINDYRELVQKRVSEDPEFLDRIAENTVEALDRLDNLVREAWETYETAKANDMINQQINLLKVAGDLEDKRSKLYQLMGAKVDGGMMARMNKAETINSIVTRVIREIISDCDVCRPQVMPRLAEAYGLMGQHEEAVDMQPEEEDVIDAEVIEESEEEWGEDQQENMMLDVLSPDS